MKKLLTNIGEFFRTMWFHRRIINNLSKEHFEAHIKEMWASQKEIGFKVENNVLFAMLCDAGVELINAYPDANNCFSIQFLGKDHKKYEVIIQRIGGKTPMDLYVECNAKYQEARELLAKLTQQAQIHFDENKAYIEQLHQLNIQQGSVTLDANEVAAENARLRRNLLNVQCRIADLMDEEIAKNCKVQLTLLHEDIRMIFVNSEENIVPTVEKSYPDTVVAQFDESDSVLEYYLYDSATQRNAMLAKYTEYRREDTPCVMITIEDLLNECNLILQQAPDDDL